MTYHHRQVNRVFWLIAPVCLLAACSQPPGNALPERHVTRGGRTTDGKLTVSGGNFFWRTGAPAILFGTRKLDGVETFAFAIVIKPPAASTESSIEQGGGTQMSDKVATATSTLKIRGSSVNAEYSFDFQAQPVEKLALGGKPVDLAKGRLFTIDLSSPAPTYSQTTFSEFEPIKTLERHEDVEEVSVKLLEAARSEVPPDFWAK